MSWGNWEAVLHPRLPRLQKPQPEWCACSPDKRLLSRCANHPDCPCVWQQKTIVPAVNTYRYQLNKRPLVSCLLPHSEMYVTVQRHARTHTCTHTHTLSQYTSAFSSAIQNLRRHMIRCAPKTVTGHIIVPESESPEIWAKALTSNLTLIRRANGHWQSREPRVCFH